ncbi:MAG TPA: hypothetical protein VMR95_01835 [Candidatus Binatia bacterium]|nr:hypothetical protein [Candidatus Binatia bacterium]
MSENIVFCNPQEAERPEVTSEQLRAFNNTYRILMKLAVRDGVDSQMVSTTEGFSPVWVTEEESSSLGRGITPEGKSLDLTITDPEGEKWPATIAVNNELGISKSGNLAEVTLFDGRGEGQLGIDQEIYTFWPDGNISGTNVAEVLPYTLHEDGTKTYTEGEQPTLINSRFGWLTVEEIREFGEDLERATLREKNPSSA